VCQFSRAVLSNVPAKAAEREVPSSSEILLPDTNDENTNSKADILDDIYYIYSAIND